MKYQNILLIDDDDDDQEVFQSAVKGIPGNFNFTGMTSAAEALEKLEAKEIVPDVIFLDLNMPGMTGQEFLIRIKGKMAIKEIPVIIFSTTSNMTTIRLTRELGAADFITKPATFGALTHILSEVLAG